MATTLKKYWRIAEVCERLAMEKSSVYALIKKGKLAIVRLPSPNEDAKGMPRVTGESLDRYERGDVTAVTPAPLDPQAVKPRTLAKRPASRASKALGYRSFR